MGESEHFLTHFLPLQVAESGRKWEKESAVSSLKFVFLQVVARANADTTGAEKFIVRRTELGFQCSCGPHLIRHGGLPCAHLAAWYKHRDQSQTQDNLPADLCVSAIFKVHTIIQHLGAEHRVITPTTAKLQQSVLRYPTCDPTTKVTSQAKRYGGWSDSASATARPPPCPLPVPDSIRRTQQSLYYMSSTADTCLLVLCDDDWSSGRHLCFGSGVSVAGHFYPCKCVSHAPPLDRVASGPRAQSYGCSGGCQQATAHHTRRSTGTKLLFCIPCWLDPRLC